MIKSISSFLIFLLVISFVGALTGTSSSYSVSTFGNGVVSGEASSNNYEVNFISENRGTTANVEGSNFRGNLGFFDQGSYSQSVSITDYSITPNSVVVGSTISLYISALNADEVWVKIIPPNSQEYTLNLINGESVTHLPIPSIVGTYQAIFYAQSSSGAIASVVDSFVLNGQISGGSPSGAASGGGGSSSTTGSCNYIWDCTPWSICSDSLQNRICTNIGTCRGVQGKPAEQIACSESLFDVLINLGVLQLEGNSISFDVFLTELLNSDELDVHIKYSIIDSENNEIFSQIETRAVNEEVSYSKVIDGLNFVSGNYRLRVDVLYGNLQRAFAEESFDYLSSGNEGITGFAGEGESTPFGLSKLMMGILVGILLFVILIYIWIYWERKKNRLRGSVSNSVLALEGLEVYTDLGIKIGKVYDVMIEENRIYGLMIAVNKEANLKYAKILIKYNYVKNVNDAVIVSSVVMDSEN